MWWIPPLPPHVQQQQQEGRPAATGVILLLACGWVLGFALGFLAFRV